MINILYGDDGLQSIRIIFEALITIGFLKDTPPEKFKDIPTVDVYQDDWKAQLKDQDEAWIITPLHYFPGSKRIHRKASVGGTWNNRDQKEENYEQTTWCVRKFKFVESTNEQQVTNGTGLQKYSMIEYLPKEDKAQYALCRITVDNKKSAHDKPPSNSHQQPKIMEIDNTDANKGDKGETSQSHKPLQRGGTFENATGNYNLPFLETKLRELREHHSYDDIRKVLDQIESEKSPAASPKEHSTEAPVSNTKCGRCTYTNTMEAGTSTLGQEQVKVETLESNSCQGDTTNLHDGTYRNCIEFGEQSSHHGNCNEKNDEQGSNPINLADSAEPCTFDDYEMVEPNAALQDPNQLSPNFIANSIEPTDNQNIIAPDPSTSFIATTKGGLGHKTLESNSFLGNTTNLHDGTYRNYIEFGEQSSHHGNSNEKNAEPGSNPINHADFAEPCTFDYYENPNQLSPNFIANSIEPTDNQNIIAPDPRTSFIATTEGELGHQMVERNADVQEPNNLSDNFNTNSTEPTDNWNYHPIYNQPSTSYAIIENWFDLPMFEPNAGVQEPNPLSQNLIANSTEPTDNQNRTVPNPSTSIFSTTEDRLDHQDRIANSMEGMGNSNQHPCCNQNTIAPGLSTSNHATTVPENIGSNNNFATIPSWTVKEMYNSYVQEIIGQNAGLQDPNLLSPTFIVNSTEATDNQNRIAPDPSTSTNTNIWFNQDPNQLSPNFIAATEGRFGHQGQINFHANSVEGMENNNQLPSYNNNTIAPGPSTSNHATIVPEIFDWDTIMKELSDDFDLN